MPWLGPIDGESFRLYVEKVLLPTLRPGDIVVSHKSQAVRQLIRSVGGGRQAVLPAEILP
jgi:hypothetical protein